VLIGAGPSFKMGTRTRCLTNNWSVSAGKPFDARCAR